MEYINNLEKEGDFHDNHDTHLMSKLSKPEDMTKEQLLELLKARDLQIEREREEHKKELEEAKKKKTGSTGYERYDEINFRNAHKTNKYKGYYDDKNKFHKGLVDMPDLYHYDPSMTAFDKISKGMQKNPEGQTIHLRNYQERFIKDWSVSTQELVILYYGVGTGKTKIAINCAEQFNALHENHHVYLLMPASLVLNCIIEMYETGIDPTRKLEDGSYVYYFVSYQQMNRSNFKFKENSLLIVDEVHNLRNFYTKEIKEKVSARKWVGSDDYSLMGNKLAEKLITSENKFMRSIFMTGTLFVNSSRDLEAIISLGYKKRPLLLMDKNEYDYIQMSDEAFKNYYQGLISLYRVEDDPKMLKQFPKKKFEFVLVKGIPAEDQNPNETDAFFMFSRNEMNEAKNNWAIDFVKKRKNEKTLIYTQFIDQSVRPLLEGLQKAGIKYAVISGEQKAGMKQNIVSEYNNGNYKVLIFTLAIKEGISFAETDNFIVLQPYWNYAILNQILARAVRLTSHKKHDESTVNFYMLVGINKESENIKEAHKWCNEASRIMNNDILKLEYKIKKNESGEMVQVEYDEMFGSRDINLYNRMFNKQMEINQYEKKLLNLPRFEDVNNNENNEFVKMYNEVLKESEQQKEMTNKEKIKLKKEMYNEFYRKNISKIDSSITRFEGDIHFKKLRNPDLESVMDKKDYDDIDVRKLLNEKASLNKILEAYGIDKKEITSFQANFTPEDEVDKLIEESGICKDPRPNLKVLEPTAGIGNIISGLLKCPNISNLMIDANEYHKVFYNIGKTTFEEISNVFYYNTDFMHYESRYPYDYIIGNPPFNLRGKRREYGKKGSFEDIDFTYYDIHFVAHAYNKLREGGKLAMIISNRHTRDKHFPFTKFNDYLKLLTDKNHKIIPLSGIFQEDEKVSKDMKVNFGMEIIILTKLGRDMDLYEQETIYFEKDEDAQQYNEENPTKRKKKTQEEENLFEDADLERELIKTKEKPPKKPKLFELPKPPKKTLKDVKEEAKKLGIKLSGKSKAVLEKEIIEKMNQPDEQKIEVPISKVKEAVKKIEEKIKVTLDGKKIEMVLENKPEVKKKEVKKETAPKPKKEPKPKPLSKLKVSELREKAKNLNISTTKLKKIKKGVKDTNKTKKELIDEIKAWRPKRRF